jgi:hypothetical protein
MKVPCDELEGISFPCDGYVVGGKLLDVKREINHGQEEKYLMLVRNACGGIVMEETRRKILQYKRICKMNYLSTKDRGVSCFIAKL